MSNSKLGEKLQPLNLPAQISMLKKNGFISPVIQLNSSSDSLTEMDRIQAASPSARFGMDIGGTLCKVVYLEPLEELCTPTSKSSNSDLVEFKGNSDGDEVTHSHTRVAAEDRFWKDGLENGSLLELDDSTKLSADPFGFSSIKTSLDALTEEELHSSRNLRKIWLSSHAPVRVAGRGTLHFKCFETWRMEEFLNLTQEHSLVSRRKEIGATGGGARKFFQRFSETAGLQLKHNDELKSLVWGIDYLVKNVNELFEYPIGSYRAGRIQRPWKSPENSSDDDENDIQLKRESKRNGGEPVNIDDNGKKQATGSHDNGEKLKTTAISMSTIFEKDCKIVHVDDSERLYPYLLVNIGSGVSILKVDSPELFQRVGGTSLGGSTFLGLASALTGCNSFEEAIALAAKGDSTQIDMLVGDIYGGDYSEMGLAATTVASSFGKLVEPNKRDAARETPQHLAKAVLLMITNNIGSIAMLHARSTGVENVLFSGSFLHGNKVAMKLLAVAMEFWSKGQIKAIFLQHEGHAGAVGAMLNVLEPSSREDIVL